jgi:hypothetical protein
MPLFDYECPKGHKTEHYLTHYQDTCPCLHEENDVECQEVAEYRPSFWYTSSIDAQRFSPVVVHVDADGNVRLPAHAEAPMPPGFQKVLLTNIHEIRKFEHKMNQVEKAKIEDHARNKVRNMNDQLAYNRAQMDEISKRFTPRGRKFYEEMQHLSKQKQEQFAGRPLAEPNFHIEAFSQDRSNREDYRDAANDWGKFGKKK